MSDLRPTIRHLEMPERMRMLPLTEAGYPALWFAAEVDGKIDLRIMNPTKRVAAVQRRLCWLCGQPLGRNMVFVLGPMCCVTRTSAEPPCHYDCANYAVRACPFLTRPRAVRREAGKPEGAAMPGIGITRNPGVAALWIARSYDTFLDGNKSFLIRVGDPVRVEWWAEGRDATYPEVVESLETGFPALIEQCDKDKDPEDARIALARMCGRVLPLLQDLPGRENAVRGLEDAGMNEAVMVMVRGEELAWFASHSGEVEYIRPARLGEYPPAMSPTPTHVRVCKLHGDVRTREFGQVHNGMFVPAPGTDLARQQAQKSGALS